jgi:hypothetical protein
VEKMRRITERRTSYKRSTNNSHKKFICVARRLLGKLLGKAERAAFEEGFQEYRNSRTYYFIILVHVKLLLLPEGVEAFRREFRTLMQNKIEYYRKELARTDNRNFIHFRCDEIADIEYALTALDLFLEDRVEEAVETIYKRDRAEVLKKQQFEAAVQVVRELEGRLGASMRPQGQVQDVIILQQNTTPPQLQQEEKSTVLQQEGQKMEQS